MGLKIIDETPTEISKYLRELEENKITKTKMFSWDETKTLINLKEKEVLEDVNKIIDEEIANEKDAKKRKTERYWTYEQELELLKNKINKKDLTENEKKIMGIILEGCEEE